MKVSHRYEFTASRRLYSSSMSEEENIQLYGKDTLQHGCTFTVEIVLSGSVSPQTGFVVSPSCLQMYVDNTMMKYLDHKQLDTDVPTFSSTVPTNENIASFLWSRFQETMTQEHKPLLHKIRLWSGANPTSVVAFQGLYCQASKFMINGMETLH